MRAQRCHGRVGFGRVGLVLVAFRCVTVPYDPNIKKTKNKKVIVPCSLRTARVILDSLAMKATTM